MKGMFENNTSVTTIPPYDMSSVTDPTYFCNGCTSLTSIEGTLDLRKVTNLYRMFYGCTKLSKIDKVIFPVESLCPADEMFTNCTSLTSLDPFLDSRGRLNFDNLSTVKNMFNGCTNLKADGICIDMGGVNYCANLFANTKVTNVKIYNPYNLYDLSSIGCSYTVIYDAF